MTKQEVIDKFKARLDKDYLHLFENEELFIEDRVLDWENLNGVYKITVIDYDGLTVDFKNNISG